MSAEKLWAKRHSAGTGEWVAEPQRFALAQLPPLRSLDSRNSDGSNAVRPPPDQRRGTIEEVGVHCALWVVEADCHRDGRSYQHGVFGTAAWDQPAPDITFDHERDPHRRQG